MGVIKIRGLEVFARHGVHGEEKINPQKFIFDADLHLDFYGGAKTDDLTLTVSYSDVCNMLVKITRENTFNLIETLAYTCAYAVLDDFPVSALELTVYKPHAPVKHRFGTVGVTVEVRREKAFLSLGSSVGDRQGYINAAIEKLSETRGIKVEKVSSVIETEPVGGVAKNKFLNCAAMIETYLTPRQLLDEIHSIEEECGRVREKRWDDRTLDIDIVFFGSRKISEEGLIIPHPEYRKRAFVLEPLKEIAPDFVCPVSGEKLSNLQIMT